MKEWIATSLRSNRFRKAVCPHCQKVLERDEIRRLATKDAFESYVQGTAEKVIESNRNGHDESTAEKAIKSNPDFNPCMEDCENEDVHRAKWHPGETCEEYDERVKRQSRQNEASRSTIAEIATKCKCGAIFEVDEDGCNHLKCKSCLFDKQTSGKAVFLTENPYPTGRDCEYESCRECNVDWNIIKSRGPKVHRDGCKHRGEPPVLRGRASMTFQPKQKHSIPSPDSSPSGREDTMATKKKPTASDHQSKQILHTSKSNGSKKSTTAMQSKQKIPAKKKRIGSRNPDWYTNAEALAMVLLQHRGGLTLREVADYLSLCPARHNMSKNWRSSIPNIPASPSYSEWFDTNARNRNGRTIKLVTITKLGEEAVRALDARKFKPESNDDIFEPPPTPDTKEAKSTDGGGRQTNNDSGLQVKPPVLKPLMHTGERHEQKRLRLNPRKHVFKSTECFVWPGNKEVADFATNSTTKDDQRLPNGISYPLQGKPQAYVHLADLERLSPRRMLNDNLIGFYARWWQENHPGSKNIYVLDSLFYKDLTMDSYRKASEWTKRVDLFEYDYVLVPINSNDHWYLAIISYLPTVKAKPGNQNVAFDDGDRSSSGEFFDEGSQAEDENHTDGESETNEAIQTDASHSRPGTRSRTNHRSKPTIIVLDSLAEERKCDNLKSFISKEYLSKHKVHMDVKRIETVNAIGIPRQDRTSNDCGLYVILYMARFMHDPEQFVSSLLNNTMRGDDWEVDTVCMRIDFRHLLERLFREQQRSGSQGKNRKKIRNSTKNSLLKGERPLTAKAKSPLSRDMQNDDRADAGDPSLAFTAQKTAESHGQKESTRTSNTPFNQVGGHVDVKVTTDSESSQLDSRNTRGSSVETESLYSGSTLAKIPGETPKDYGTKTQIGSPLTSNRKRSCEEVVDKGEESSNGSPSSKRLVVIQLRTCS